MAPAAHSCQSGKIGGSYGRRVDAGSAALTRVAICALKSISVQILIAQILARCPLGICRVGSSRRRGPQYQSSRSVGMPSNRKISARVRSGKSCRREGALATVPSAGLLPNAPLPPSHHQTITCACRYSNVFEAQMLGARVALKETSTKKDTSTPSLFREIRYLRQCGPHPNIVQLFGAFKEAGRVCLVMELAKYVSVPIHFPSQAQGSVLLARCAVRIAASLTWRIHRVCETPRLYGGLTW